jgi:RimK family alpha-L-glutamate ligase
MLGALAAANLRTPVRPAGHLRGSHVPQVAVFGSAGNETNFDLVERWRAYGIQASLVSQPDALATLDRGDTVVARLDVLTTLDGVQPGLTELLAAVQAGTRVLNGPTAILNAHDKLRTALALGRAGVAHPRTAHLQAGEALPLAPPLVVKPRFGSWGQDVMRCDSEDEAGALLAGLAEREWFRRQGALIQELVPPTGEDLRIVVAGGVAVGAEVRLAAPGDWRTNISLGGAHRRIATPAPAAIKLALAAVQAVGGDFMGVDLLPVGSGYTVIEINAAVDFDSGYSLPGSDVFGDIADALDLPLPQPRARSLMRIAGEEGVL